MKTFHALIIATLLAPACTIQTQPAATTPGQQPPSQPAAPSGETASEPTDPTAAPVAAPADDLTAHIDASDQGWPVALRAPAGTTAAPIAHGVLEIVFDGDVPPEAYLVDLRETDPDRADPTALSNPDTRAAHLQEDLGRLYESGDDAYASSVIDRGYWLRYRDSDGDAHVEVVLYDLGLRCEGRATTEDAIVLVQDVCLSVTRTGAM